MVGGNIPWSLCGTCRNRHSRRCIPNRYFNTQKTLRENTSVLLENKKALLQLEIVGFQKTKDSLITENKNLRSNSAYLNTRIIKSDETKIM